MKLLIGLCALLAFVLVGCGHNTSGHGNEFKIQATVYHVGKHSVNVSDINVLASFGKAEKWFHGRHQIHNNYNTCGWHPHHRVGREYDAGGLEIHLQDLHAGDRVEIVGAIRQNASQCGKNQYWKWRPVYESLRKID